MEHPNNMIDSFTGVITINGESLPILPTNILLRGTVLRNTDYVLGVVVNTGHDTKIMMSNTKTKPKTSNLESKASFEIVKIMCLLATVCLAGAIGSTIWNALNKANQRWYFRWTINAGEYFVIQFFYYFLLHATFIPVSLYVSMAVIRSLQSYFMNNDLEMYYAPTDTPALVRTMTLNEELGQISHVFSDKTGTLTCNLMDFRKMSINGVVYGRGITEIGKAAWKLKGIEIPSESIVGEQKSRERAVPHVAFWCPQYEADMQSVDKHQQREKIYQFFRTLCLCHDAIPETVDGRVKLSASNPDDEAFICAAEYFGFQFIDRRNGKCVFLDASRGGAETEVTLLETIAFTSKRKKMSVIVKDDTTGAITLLCKGADTAILPKLRLGQDDLLAHTNTQMDAFAMEGLRTLLITCADLTLPQYTRWHAEYAQACADLDQIEKKKNGLDNRIDELEGEIEQDLTLLGVTALEDRLQDGVPECIACLAAAGVKIWVLTGDKEETAINIGVACNLLLPGDYMEMVIVNKTTCPTPGAMIDLLTDHIQQLDRDTAASHNLLAATGVGHRGVADTAGMGKGAPAAKPRALVIDGPSLISIMADESHAMQDVLLAFSNRCRAVVACRVSPDQKRSMVRLVKLGVPGVRTLSIGDGANDVAMIQEAHVGVGIRGEEGVQAVNSSDFAIAQFRYLQVLMLKHGRSNYMRMSNLICHMFYKNILMSMCQWWFNFNNAWSGQKYFTEGAIQLFNAIFTLLPIIMLGVYDMDLKPSTVYRYPQLYGPCIRNERFNVRLFWGWIGMAMVESVILSVLPMYFQQNESAKPMLGGMGFWESGSTCYTAVIIVVNCKVLGLLHRWNWCYLAIVVLSLGAWFFVAFLISSSLNLDYDFFHTFLNQCMSGIFWLQLLLLCWVIFAKDLYIAGWQRSFRYTSQHIIEEMEFLGRLEGDIDSSGKEPLGLPDDSHSWSQKPQPIPVRAAGHRTTATTPPVVDSSPLPSAPLPDQEHGNRPRSTEFNTISTQGSLQGANFVHNPMPVRSVSERERTDSPVINVLFQRAQSKSDDAYDPETGRVEMGTYRTSTRGSI